MKLIIMIFIATTIFAQVKIDSAKAVKSGNTVTLYSYSTFEVTPSADLYDVGFWFGKSYNDVTYIPMGSYSWNAPALQLTHWTELTNLEITSKHYFVPYIMPKSLVTKIEVSDSDGWLDDIICEPVIESASSTKSLTQPLGETITFNVTVEDREETCVYNYQWQYWLASDSLQIDTVANDTTTIYYYVGDWANIGENLNEWETPALQQNFHYAKARCRVYNDSGEDISIEGLIKIED